MRRRGVDEDRGAGGLRIGHLTTVDMSLALLLATELEVDVAAGHTVFGVSAAGPYVSRVERLGVTHVPVGSLTRSWSLPTDVRAFVELLRTIRRLDLDVLHTHNPKTGVMGRVVGRLTGVPVVVNTCHGLWARPADSWKRRAFVYSLEGVACRFSDYELFQNAEDQRTLRRALRPGRSRVVGNGVDLVRFRPDPDGRARVRAELGVGADELLVGAVGRRVTEKGLAEFVGMARRLRGRARFVWVGPEEGPPQATGEDDAVTFLGERSDMTALYSAMDVFVLPTHREGFSRAGMEAAACGLPMVLTDIRGCRELGEHETHLLLVPPHETEALVAAVDRLLGDEGLRSRLGARARASALERFDQREVAATSLRTYATIAEEKGLLWGAPG